MQTMIGLFLHLSGKRLPGPLPRQTVEPADKRPDREQVSSIAALIFGETTLGVTTPNVKSYAKTLDAQSPVRRIPRAQLRSPLNGPAIRTCRTLPRAVPFRRCGCPAIPPQAPILFKPRLHQWLGPDPSWSRTHQPIESSQVRDHQQRHVDDRYGICGAQFPSHPRKADLDSVVIVEDAPHCT